VKGGEFAGKREGSSDHTLPEVQMKAILLVFALLFLVSACASLENYQGLDSQTQMSYGGNFRVRATSSQGVNHPH